MQMQQMMPLGQPPLGGQHSPTFLAQPSMIMTQPQHQQPSPSPPQQHPSQQQPPHHHQAEVEESDVPFASK